jgi:HK97 family phage portal protein
MPFMVKYPDGTRGVWYKCWSNDEIIKGEDMIHWVDMGQDPCFGVSRISLHAELIGMSKASLDFRNKLYSNGLQLGGTVEYPVDSKVTDAQLTDLRRSFETIYQGVVKRMRVAFLNNGGTFKPLKAGMSFADIQHIESEKFTQAAILSLFLTPPGKIGLGDSKYNNLESMLTDFDRNVLVPLCVGWEQEHNRKIFRESEKNTHYIKCSIDALGRASLESQINYMTKAIGAGILTPNEVRALKDLNPYPGGEKALIPVNNVIPADRVNEWVDAYLSGKVGTTTKTDTDEK